MNLDHSPIPVQLLWYTVAVTIVSGTAAQLVLVMLLLTSTSIGGWPGLARILATWCARSVLIPAFAFAAGGTTVIAAVLSQTWAGIVIVVASLLPILCVLVGARAAYRRTLRWLRSEPATKTIRADRHETLAWRYTFHTYWMLSFAPGAMITAGVVGIPVLLVRPATNNALDGLLAIAAAAVAGIVVSVINGVTDANYPDAALMRCCRGHLDKGRAGEQRDSETYVKQVINRCDACFTAAARTSPAPYQRGFRTASELAVVKMAEDLRDQNWRAPSVTATIRAALDPKPLAAGEPLVFELGSTAPSLQHQVKIMASVVAAIVTFLASMLGLFGAIVEQLHRLAGP